MHTALALWHVWSGQLQYLRPPDVDAMEAEVDRKYTVKMLLMQR